MFEYSRSGNESRVERRRSKDYRRPDQAFAEFFRQYCKR
jgi:hypothetical protein